MQVKLKDGIIKQCSPDKVNSFLVGMRLLQDYSREKTHNAFQEESKQQVDYVEVPDFNSNHFDLLQSVCSLLSKDKSDFTVNASYPEFLSFKKTLTHIYPTLPMSELAPLNQLVSEQNKQLILLDLGEMIYFTAKSGDKTNGRPIFQVPNNPRRFILRPGSIEFFKKLHSHDRLKIAAYTTMMRKNCEPCLVNIYKQAGIPTHPIIFDQDCSKEMSKNKRFKHLIPDGKFYKRYKDLTLIQQAIQSEERFENLRQYNFDESNTLHVDSESEKVQLLLDNALVAEEFNQFSVLNLPVWDWRTDNYVYRSDKDHYDYMNSLADYILKLADQCSGSVQDYLRKQNNPYSPVKMDLKYKRKNIAPGLTREEALDVFKCQSMAHLGERCLSETCVSCSIWSGQYDNFIEKQSENVVRKNIKAQKSQQANKEGKVDWRKKKENGKKDTERNYKGKRFNEESKLQ